MRCDRKLLRKIAVMGVLTSVAAVSAAQPFGGVIFPEVRAYAAEESAEEITATYDISAMTPDELTGMISINIDAAGRYLFKGTNYRSEGDCYIDVQVTIAEGVEADLVFDGLDISNKGYFVDCGDYGCLNTPFIVNGTANVYIESASQLDVDLTGVNSEGYNVESKSDMFSGSGSVNFVESKDRARLTMLNASGVNVSISGAEVAANMINHWSSGDYKQSDGYFSGTVYGGRAVIDGGYCDFKNLSLEDAPVNSDGTAVYKTTVSGLPADSPVSYLHGTQLSFTYTDANGELLTYLPDYSSTGILVAADGDIYVYTPEDCSGNPDAFVYADPDKVSVNADDYLISKTYDGTTAAGTATGELTVDFTGFTVTAGEIPAYDVKDVGEQTLTLPMSVQYDIFTIPLEAEVAATITPAELTITDAVVADKTYDGTTDAQVTSVTIDGAVAGEEIAYDATAAFDDREIGTDKPVTVTVSVSDTNYVLDNAAFATTADITAIGVTATPVLTADGGKEFSETRSVTITCSTEGADIFYTLDGTDPTTESTLYEKPIVLDATTTVKAFAVCEGYEDSDIASAIYTKASTGGSGGGSGSYGGGYNRLPELNDIAMPWSEMAPYLERMAEGTDVTIELIGNYDVPYIIISAIKNRKIHAEFIIDSSRSWMVEGSEIIDAASVDLRVVALASLNTDGLYGTVGRMFRIDGVVIPAGLVVTFDKTDAGRTADVYRKTDDGYVLIDSVMLDAAGRTPELDVTAKGEYVIMLSERSRFVGDVNSDGIVDENDVVELLDHIVGLTDSVIARMGDFNGDGIVNALDASAILADMKKKNTI